MLFMWYKVCDDPAVSDLVLAYLPSTIAQPTNIPSDRRAATSRRLEDARLPPLVPQCPDADRRAGRTFDILDIKQFVLLAECEEVCEEGVEVAFGA